MCKLTFHHIKELQTLQKPRIKFLKRLDPKVVQRFFARFQAQDGPGEWWVVRGDGGAGEKVAIQKYIQANQHRMGDQTLSHGGEALD